MMLLQLELPLLALSPSQVTVTVPQPFAVLPPAKSAAGTALKHCTEVLAGQVIVGPVQAALTVSCCVALVSEPFAPVIVGVPAFASLYLKSALLWPLAIWTVVIFAVSAVFRKTPPAEVLLRLTVSGPPVVGFPN
jgi:hypothetical protein